MAELESAANGNEISRDRLAELLNEDLSRENQAICSSSRTVLPVVRPNVQSVRHVSQLSTVKETYHATRSNRSCRG